MSEAQLTGIPHFTAELVRALDNHTENGKTFSLKLVIAYDKKDRLSRWKFKNVNIVSVPIPMRILNLLWKYRLLLPMDIFLGKGTYLFPNYKNWPLLRSKSMTYIHDLGYIRYPEFVQPNNLKFLQKGMNIWIRRSDIVLTGSDHTKHEIIDLLGVPSAKIVRIYHGLDHRVFYRRSPEEIKKAKNKYDISGEYIGAIGSFEPRKNLIKLIDAYKELPQQLRDNYSLCLIGGGGWLNEEIFAKIKTAQTQGCNIIQPNRYVEDQDLPALISGATALVHPALYEGFGLPPLQAMACGTATIVADNSSLPEVVGKAGILINAESVSDISAKIEKTLTDTSYRNSMESAGIAQAQKFTWATTAQEVLNQIYKLDNN